MTRPRRFRLLPLLAAALLAGAGLFVAPQLASAASGPSLSGGYSLDCSGDQFFFPTLRLSRTIESDNQGNTSGTTSLYFTLSAPGQHAGVRAAGDCASLAGDGCMAA